jgi:hypothetical protein
MEQVSIAVTIYNYIQEELIKLTYSTEQGPSWEANSHSASQEIPRLLWNPKVRFHVHNSPPLVLYSHTPNFPKIHSNIIF